MSPSSQRPLFAEALPAWLSWAEAPADRLVCLLMGESCDHFANEWGRQLASDTEVRSLLEDQFSCHYARVDEYPLLASELQHVLGLTAQSQGWPVLAFGIPNKGSIAWCGAMPFGPLRDSDKRMGIARVALELLETYQQHGDQLLQDALFIAQQQPRAPEQAMSLPKASLVQPNIEAALLENADTLEGGFGQAPRYLQPAALTFLLSRVQSGQAPVSIRQQVERSLDALIAGACHDHLAGGFFHGCEDNAWCRPFFHKTLSDNSQLATILLQAAVICQRPVYKAVGLQTLAWILNNLQRSDGWYAAGFAADAPNAHNDPQPGAHVLWSRQAAEHVVGSDLGTLFSEYYLHDERSAYDEEWFAPCLRKMIDNAEESEPQLINAVHRLAVAREERPQPLRDDHVFLQDQALLCRALSLASRADSDEAQWSQRATALWKLINTHVAESLVSKDNQDTNYVGTLASCAWAASLQGESDQADFLLDHALSISLDWRIALDSNDQLSAVSVLCAALAEQERQDDVEHVLHQFAYIVRQAPVCMAGALASWRS